VTPGGIRPTGGAGTPEALLASADALLEKGEVGPAIDALRAALAQRPDFAPASFTLAQALWMRGDLEASAEKLRDGLRVMPQVGEAHNNLGLIYKTLGRYDAAIDSFNRALAIHPGVAWVHCNLGNAHQAKGDADAAIASYRRALALDPRHAESHFNLANVLKDRGDLESAVASYRQALSLRPDNALGHVALGSALQSQGELDAALASFRKAQSLDPENADAGSGVLFTINIHPGFSASERVAEARRYGSALARRAQPFTGWNVDAADRSADASMPLRVGLVSGDLRMHPVGFFVESVLGHIDADRIALIAYPTLAREDELSARIKSRFAAWNPIAGLDDAAAARRIRDDGIHCLVDLSGHTALNRLPVFAWRPAPVQLSWLGYFATTGVPAIDYVLADRVSVPESARDQFTETVWHLPDSRFCFTPPASATRLDPAPLPALRNRRITFGSFQNPLKLSDAVLAAWGRIVHALPGSRLRLQNSAMAFEPARSRLLQRLARAGIAPDRVTLSDSMPRDAYLLAHAEVDIILDTFPYTGATTTCEALWMGVPTLTLAGDTLVSRQGASLLASAGLSDWIADDEAAYVARAVDFASDLDRLGRLRSRLREQIVASPLCDAARFARNFEEALLGMWRNRDPGKALVTRA
jgi:predicted O-linked N-acetylglucosamine transferase (SPINDLY family)